MEEHQSAQATAFPLPDKSSGDGATESVAARSKALIVQGKPAAAEQLLRLHLTQDAPDPALVAQLVHALLAQGRALDGLDLANGYCSTSSSPAPAVLILRAQILLALGRLEEAIAAYRDAVAAAPDDGVAQFGLAVAFGQGGQARAANAAAQLAIAKGADNAGSRTVLARSYFDMHRYDDAEQEFRYALGHKPWDVAAHTSLAELVWMRTHDVRSALMDIDKALSQQQGARALDLQLVKARMLGAAGQRAEAMEGLEHLISSNPRHVPLRIMAARTSIGIDVSRSAYHAEHAMRLAPGSVSVSGLYGDTMLASGRPEAAADIAQQLLDRTPHDNHAIALRTAAWRLLGDPRHLPFHDYTSLVQASRLDVPPGWQDIGHYLAELAEALLNTHALQAEPVEQSVRHGTQVEHRTGDTSQAAIRAFPLAIAGAISRYMAKLGHGDSPWHRQATGSYRLNGLWSVRLRSQGHHVSHFHGKGWISSACYIQVPKAVDERGGQGWLKFGEPGVPTQPSLGADYFLRPVPGMLVLFPSWMWHGTVPFASATEEHRLTMAFDVVPTAST